MLKKPKLMISSENAAKFTEEGKFLCAEEGFRQRFQKEESKFKCQACANQQADSRALFRHRIKWPARSWYRNKKYTSIIRKVPNWHDDVPIVSLRSPNKLYIAFILYFLIILFSLCCWFDKKLEVCSTVVSILLKIRFGHAQISVPKISISMLKTGCINPCQPLEMWKS